MFFILSEENSSYVNKLLCNQYCIVLYHWKDCGHCKMLMPTWNKVCKKYMKYHDITIINVEADQMPLLKAKYKKNIAGFPTIIKFQNGKRIQEFNDDRKPRNIMAFIETKII